MSVDRIGQFAKLLHDRCPFIEHRQRRVNRDKVTTGVRTAKAPHARVGGRRGINRQQVQNAATQRVHDMRQFSDQVTKGAAGRDNGVTLVIQLSDVLIFIAGRGIACGFIGAKHSRESAINGIGTPRIIGVN